MAAASSVGLETRFVGFTCIIALGISYLLLSFLLFFVFFLGRKVVLKHGQSGDPDSVLDFYLFVSR